MKINKSDKTNKVMRKEVSGCPVYLSTMSKNKLKDEQKAINFQRNDLLKIRQSESTQSSSAGPLWTAGNKNWRKNKMFN
jgi:hypothetical protein